jgi:hypothetical protein
MAASFDVVTAESFMHRHFGAANLGSYFLRAHPFIDVSSS